MLLYNGQLLFEEDFALTLPNRGLFFNDGFFETLVWAEDTIRYLPHHLARMQRAADVLGLELPPELASASHLTQTLGKLVAENILPQANPAYRLRLQVWRGGGGLYTPETTACNWLATSRSFHPNNAPALTAGFAETVRTHFSPVSGCKGPNSLTYVLAARERTQRRLDELLLLDAAGHVAESVAAAVFWISKNQLYTSPLETGCVAGVRRAHLLAIAQQHHVPVAEVLAQPAVLEAAEMVFTANVAGIRVVQQLGAVTLASEHALLMQLRQWEAHPS
ncbi:aminotransferase class IV [Hymenobacter norwichensis]|uniref:aminotransferase class IV n=1 Tax=Hymenobacter norwichensis TaxID=223903 RepID=UPI0003B65CE2|nr:aminotransferase class IV [Hymenobacter norwichensis]